MDDSTKKILIFTGLGVLFLAVMATVALVFIPARREKKEQQEFLSMLTAGDQKQLEDQFLFDAEAEKARQSLQANEGDEVRVLSEEEIRALDQTMEMQQGEAEIPEETKEKLDFQNRLRTLVLKNSVLKGKEGRSADGSKVLKLTLTTPNLALWVEELFSNSPEIFQDEEQVLAAAEAFIESGEQELVKKELEIPILEGASGKRYSITEADMDAMSGGFYTGIQTCYRKELQKLYEELPE